VVANRGFADPEPPCDRSTLDAVGEHLRNLLSRLDAAHRSGFR
jgi:hypothetical protein